MSESEDKRLSQVSVIEPCTHHPSATTFIDLSVAGSVTNVAQ